VVLDSETGVTPAIWMSQGNYVAYGTADAGWLVPVTSEGVGEKLEIPNWNYGCPLFFTDETHFVYGRCGDAGPGFELAEVGETVVSVSLDVGSYTLADANGGCIATTDGSELNVGKAAANVELQRVIPDGNTIAELFLDPAGRGLGWVTSANAILWQPLANCEPVGNSTGTGLPTVSAPHYQLPN
jgi:hypothetical protein